MHILSVEQFDKKSLEVLFQKADEFQKQIDNPIQRRELSQKYVGRQMCSLFYEPSTRTRVSFEKAALNLGMGIVSTENAREFSSAAKGETIEDTIRVLDGYGFDVIVMRHDETGSAVRAAKISQTPIVNAGDGKGEHPTQALLDVYTINKRFNRLSNLNVVIGGDLAHGRTARSLAQILSKYENNRIWFVSTPDLQIGEDIKQRLNKNGTDFEETEMVDEAFESADVVYWTRLQKERIENKELLNGKNFVIDKRVMEVTPKTAIVMHPLPRVDEISVEVDFDPRAIYFEQAKNGLFVRMALIDQVLSEPSL